jgi:hypothetical protein
MRRRIRDYTPVTRLRRVARALVPAAFVQSKEDGFSVSSSFKGRLIHSIAILAETKLYMLSLLDYCKVPCALMRGRTRLKVLRYFTLCLDVERILSFKKDTHDLGHEDESISPCVLLIH